MTSSGGDDCESVLCVALEVVLAADVMRRDGFPFAPLAIEHFDTVRERLKTVLEQRRRSRRPPRAL
jgi:hypothetical protein